MPDTDMLDDRATFSRADGAIMTPCGADAGMGPFGPRIHPLRKCRGSPQIAA